jgi:MFS family permease
MRQPLCLGQFHLNSQSNGMVVSAVLLGAMLGSIVSGRAADRYGRRKLLISVALIFGVSSLLTAFSENITVLIIDRIIVGVAVGIASYTAPLYISEISPARYRGRLVSINQIAISLGILLSYVVDYMWLYVE